MFLPFLASSKEETSPSHRAASAQGGFGLIELLVTISIMVIVSAIILVRQSAFNGAVLMRGQAYEVAFQIREAQLSAVSASGNTGDFRSVVGVYFSSDTNADDRVRTFLDADNDYTYDGGEDLGFSGLLDPRFMVREIRTGVTTPSQVAVTFERPNFDARFYNFSGVEIMESTIEIDIARRNRPNPGTCGEDYRTVEVTQTGQIAVLSCP